MNNNTNAINWFEIPATDIDRARSFYENIFGIEMQTMSMMGMDMAMFPYDGVSGKASGAVVKSDMHMPSQSGAIVYLNANEAGMDNVLNKIEGAGGQVMMPRTLIDEETGYMAFFTDTEGNRIGLHSMN
ncbi:MAG: VOC family protein [Sphingobacteriales bacterium]|nr:MAG: VOC family protein [Sphingobacteriales bacterium]